MDRQRPALVTDTTVADWIGPLLQPPLGGNVGSVVPRGFQAYARVLHPVTEDGVSPSGTRWADVCASTGATAHAQMQWEAIAGVDYEETRKGWRQRAVRTRTSRWPGGDPEIGSLEPGALGVLCDVLARHTACDTICYFALWEGYGWIHGSPSVMHLTTDGSTPPPIPPAFPPEVLNGLKVQLPGRNYLLFSGRLRDALAVGDPRGVWDQSPNLFWPADRSWCVATEIDFDSTLVGGSTSLVQDVLAEPKLESWPIDEPVSLAADRDTINS